MADIIDLDGRRIEPVVLRAIEGFLRDPTSTDYQAGYLAALIEIYRAGLRHGAEDARPAVAEKLLRSPLAWHHVAAAAARDDDSPGASAMTHAELAERAYPLYTHNNYPYTQRVASNQAR